MSFGLDVLILVVMVCDALHVPGFTMGLPVLLVLDTLCLVVGVVLLKATREYRRLAGKETPRAELGQKLVCIGLSVITAGLVIWRVGWTALTGGLVTGLVFACAMIWFSGRKPHQPAR